MQLPERRDRDSHAAAAWQRQAGLPLDSSAARCKEGNGVRVAAEFANHSALTQAEQVWLSRKERDGTLNVN